MHVVSVTVGCRVTILTAPFNVRRVRVLSGA